MFFTPSLDYFHVPCSFFPELITGLAVNPFHGSFLIFRGSLAVPLPVKGPSDLGSQSINYGSAVSTLCHLSHLQAARNQWAVYDNCWLWFKASSQGGVRKPLHVFWESSLKCGRSQMVSDTIIWKGSAGFPLTCSAHVWCSGGVVLALEHPRLSRSLELAARLVLQSVWLGRATCWPCESKVSQSQQNWSLNLLTLPSYHVHGVNLSLLQHTCVPVHTSQRGRK